MKIKRTIVSGLETLCGVLDRVPVFYRYKGKWYFDGGGIGCYWFNLSMRSYQLDERWGTGVWKESVDE